MALFAPAGQYPDLFGPNVSGAALPPPPSEEDDPGVFGGPNDWGDLGDLGQMLNPLNWLKGIYHIGEKAVESASNIPSYIAGEDPADPDRPRVEDDPFLNEALKPIGQSLATTAARAWSVAPFGQVTPDDWNPFGKVAVGALSDLTGADEQQVTKSLYGKDQIPSLEDYKSKPFTAAFEDLTNLGVAVSGGLGAAAKGTGLAARLANAGAKVSRILPEAADVAEVAAKAGAVADVAETAAKAAVGVSDDAGRVSVAAERASPTVSGSAPELLTGVGEDVAKTVVDDVARPVPQVEALGGKSSADFFAEAMNKFDPAAAGEHPGEIAGLLDEALVSGKPGELLADRYLSAQADTNVPNWMTKERLTERFDDMVASSEAKASTEAVVATEETAGAAAAATEAAAPAPPLATEAAASKATPIAAEAAAEGPAVAGAAPQAPLLNTAKNPLASRLFEASENFKQTRYDLSLRGLMNKEYVNKQGVTTSAKANMYGALNTVKDKTLAGLETKLPGNWQRAEGLFGKRLSRELRTEALEPGSITAAPEEGYRSLMRRQAATEAGDFKQNLKANERLAETDPAALIAKRGDLETAKTAADASRVAAEVGAESRLLGKHVGVGDEAIGDMMTLLSDQGTFKGINELIDNPQAAVNVGAAHRLDDTYAAKLDADRVLAGDTTRVADDVVAEAQAAQAVHAQRYAADTDYAARVETVDRPIAQQVLRNQGAVRQWAEHSGHKTAPGELRLNMENMRPAEAAAYEETLGRRDMLADDLAAAETQHNKSYETIRQAVDDPATAPQARVDMRQDPVYVAGEAAREGVQAVRQLEQDMLGTGITPGEYSVLTARQKALLPAEVVQHFELHDHLGHILSDEASVAKKFSPEQAAQLRQMYAGSASTLVDLNEQGVKMQFLPKHGDTLDPTVIIHNADLDVAKEAITNKVMDQVYNDARFSKSGDELYRGIPAADKSRYPDTNIDQQIDTYYKGEWAKQEGTDRWLPKGLDDKIKNYSIKGTGTSANKAFASVYDPLQNLWRVATLFFSPAYHVNNIVGGFVLSTLVGGVRLTDYIPKMVAAKKLLARGGELSPDIFKGFTGRLAKKGLGDLADQPELLRNITRRGTQESLINAEVGPHGGPSTAGIYPRLAGEKGTALAKGAAKYSGAQAIYHGSRRFAEGVDNMNRVATALDKAQKTGVGAKEAVALAARALPSVQEFGPFEKTVVRRLYPFYGWMKHIAKVGVQMADPSQLLERSILMAKVAQLYDKYDPPEAKLLPSYRQGALKLGDNNWLSLKAAFPLSDLLGYADAENIPQALMKPMAPIPKIIVGEATGVDTGTGRAYTSPWPDEEGKPRGPSLMRQITGQFRQARLAEDISAGLAGHPLERYSTGESRYTTTTTPKQLWQSLAQAAGASVFSFDPQQHVAQNNKRITDGYKRSLKAQAKLAAREGKTFTPDALPALQAWP